MIRKDFIMRMIEEMVNAIHHALHLTDERQYDEAREALSEAVGDLVTLKLEAVLGLDSEELISILQLHHNTDWMERAVALAALLKVEGDVAMAEEQPIGQFTAYLKSLQLLLLADNGLSEFPELTPSFAELMAVLDEYVLPANTYQALLDYYEQTNQLALGEDVLFTWLEEYEDETAVAVGINYYQRLQHKSDEELIAGNLPRAEVEAGLQELLDSQP
jgi:hypothetical protein